MNIKHELTKTPKKMPADQNNLGFGIHFTNHMFIMDYKEGMGWNNARIVPYGPLMLDPAAMCLHYGQEVFEGMKAYRTDSGEIQLFRPQENFKRLNQSNDRLCIPQIDEDFALKALKELLNVERDWVPTAPGASLYIRPFIIATDAHIGVRAAYEYMFIIILSPVGAYYKEGFNPIKIYVETKYVRSVKGGTGTAKAGGNYAASLKAQDEAKKEGYAQVLWLDGVHRKYLEEVGTTNVFFVINNEVITPDLDGSILPGITRKSVIEMLRSWGHKVSERKLSIDEVVEANNNGTLSEAFATGTAAVISPIGELKVDDKILTLSGGKIGELSQKLYDTLTAIQWGKAPDSFGWVESI